METKITLNSKIPLTTSRIDIKVNYSLPTSYFEDLFITAFEGGSYYWAEVSDECPYKDDKLALSERWWRHILNGNSMKVVTVDGDVCYYSRERLIKALQKMSDVPDDSVEFQLFKDILNEEIMDADQADTIFQIVVLGSVIYA